MKAPFAGDVNARAALDEICRAWRKCPVCAARSGLVHDAACPVTGLVDALGEYDQELRRLSDEAADARRKYEAVALRRTGFGEFARRRSA